MPSATLPKSRLSGKRSRQQAYERPMPPQETPDNAVAIGLFLDTLRANQKAEGTVYKYQLLLWSLADQIHPVALLDATTPDLLRWQRASSHLAHGTVANKVAQARAFYRWCVRPMHWLDHSPAD